MSSESKGVDNVSGDEDEFQDACTRENEKIVDALFQEQLKNLSMKSNNDNQPKIDTIELPTSSNASTDDENQADHVECEANGSVEIDDESEAFDGAVDVIDEEGLKEAERDLTEEQKKANKEKADTLKAKGNELFKNESYTEAVNVYTEALIVCPVEGFANERAILYANRAAAKIKLDSKKPAIEDCTKALEFNPTYMKALLRRAKLYEDIDKLDESLEDYKAINKLDPSNLEAGQATIRLPQQINERNEKLKEEMMDKLKDLGNMILRPFGLSTKNFQMQQDPNTGSYSVNFNQNPQ